MARALEAHDKVIQEIFEGSYQFQIPDYQRPYAWTLEQTEELFTDLVEAMRDARETGAERQYFLGSIVLIKQDKQLKSLVVDGQQRLTTLTMLFAVMRALMPHAHGDITKFIYKEGSETLGEKNEYRLIVREEDAEFFRNHIQAKNGLAQLLASKDVLQDSRLHYQENARLLYGKIQELSDADRLALWQFIAKDCSIVIISTPDLDAAYRIFSVLNNRGLDLAPIDILKADVLGAFRNIYKNDEQKNRTYAKEWTRIESDLGRDAFGELFAHVRTIYAKQKQRSTLVKEFKEHVTDYNTPTILVDDIIKPYAEIWDFLRNANFEATECADQINKHLGWLNLVDFKDWVPPALACFKRFRQHPRELAAFVQSLERLTYFLLATKAGVGDRIDTYAALTGEIEAAENSAGLVSLPTLRLSDSQKHAFREALNGDIYRKLPKARMALILRLENLMGDGSKTQTFHNVSLEHVLPQTPPENSEWLSWFANDEEREAWTHRLANLVPLHFRKNPAASNYDFAKKKDVYFRHKGKDSPFLLTQQVRNVAAWTPGILAQRQDRLLGVLTKHWDLG